MATTPTRALQAYWEQNPSLQAPLATRAALLQLIDSQGEDKNAALLRGVVHDVFDGADPTAIRWNLDGLGPQDGPYIETMLRQKTVLSRGELGRARPPYSSIASRELDFLAVDRPVDTWSLARLVNFALSLAVPKQRRAALVATVRNEGISLLEWIAHHRALGFEGLFIYSNNNTDGSTELLSRLAAHGVIWHIDNQTGSETAPQPKAYDHALHMIHETKSFEWLCFLDADEFFIPHTPPSFDLSSFFSDLGDMYFGVEPSCVLLNWKWFGSANVFERTPGFVRDRFTRSIEDNHVKFIAKSKDIISARRVHVPTLFKDCKATDGDFYPVEIAGPKYNPAYSKGQINHYWNKSFEEFVIKKLRGRAAVAATGPQRAFQDFFNWGNGNVGNLDVPLHNVRDRTEKAYKELLALPGIAEDLARIEDAFRQHLAQADAVHNLRKLHAARGRT